MSCAFIPRYLLQRLVAVTDDDHVCHSGKRTLDLDQERRRVWLGSTPAGVAAARTPGPSPALATTPLRLHRPTPVRIWTANHAEQLPGRPLRTNDDPPIGDPLVDGLVDLAHALQRFCRDVLELDSWDGRGTPIDVTVKFGSHYDNAFTDGRRFVFGDGDGHVFTPFAAHPDVFAHLFGHAVLDARRPLRLRGEPGAIAESFADVFACVFDQWRRAQSVEDADWLIGRGVFSERVDAPVLRSLVDPGTGYDDPALGSDPQVGSMAGYIRTADDDCGVHANSGIPSRAFVSAARSVGGHSWLELAPIWWAALTEAPAASAGSTEPDFAGFARAGLSAAARLFPDQPTITERIRDSWIEVGVLPVSEQPQTTPDAGPEADAATETDAAPETVIVRRSGGIAGSTRQAELDLAADRRAPEVRQLLQRIDLTSPAAASSSPAGADRFVYTVEYAGQRVTVGERDLGQDLGRLVKIVMGS